MTLIRGWDDGSVMDLVLLLLGAECPRADLVGWDSARQGDPFPRRVRARRHVEGLLFDLGHVHEVRVVVRAEAVCADTAVLLHLSLPRKACKIFTFENIRSSLIRRSLEYPP